MESNTAKKKNSLLNLKKTQYQEGAELALENAESLLEIAKTCHQKGFNGNGASILITSLEELSKSAYLKIKAHNPHIVIKELESFFKDHKIKHQAIIKLYSKTIINNINALPEEKQNSAGLVVIGTFLILAFVASKAEQPINFDLEKVRQRGYYVNFDEAKSYWRSPKDLIPSESFSAYISVVESIFENVKKDLFNGSLTDIHTKKYIDELQDENVYFRKTYKSVHEQKMRKTR